MTSLELIRMPVFAALSGFLYAARRAQADTLGKFWRKKLSRLLIPLMVLTVLTWTLRGWAYGSETGLATALVFSYQHFWFLQALLLILAAVSIWDACRAPGWGELCLAAFVIMLLSPLHGVTFLSFGGALYLSPYFIVGMLLRIHPNLLKYKQIDLLVLGIFTTVIINQQVGLSESQYKLLKSSFPAFLCGAAVFVLLVKRMPRNSLLAMIGSCSYTVFLWHSISNATVRSILFELEIRNLPVLFVTGVVTSLLIPSIIHRATTSMPLFSLVLTGREAKSRSELLKARLPAEVREPSPVPITSVDQVESRVLVSVTNSYRQRPHRREGGGAWRLK